MVMNVVSVSGFDCYMTVVERLMFVSLSGVEILRQFTSVVKPSNHSGQAVVVVIPLNRLFVPPFRPNNRKRQMRL